MVLFELHGHGHQLLYVMKVKANNRVFNSLMNFSSKAAYSTKSQELVSYNHSN